MSAVAQAKWQRTKLGEIAEFRNGLNFSKENFGKGLKVIGVSNFKDYLFPRYEELDEINPEGVAKDDDLLIDNDILFVRSNGNRSLIGRSVFIRALPQPVSHSGFTIRLRFHSDVVVPRFYAYLFRGDVVRQVLSAFGGGTNINNLNQQILKGLDVPLPTVEEQHRVVSVLSAYDDLIENNERRIKILEEMAQNLYREWFVNFHFPGHEKVKMVDSELGMIPEGWEVKRLDEVVEFNPKLSVEKNVEKPYVAMGGVSTGSMLVEVTEYRTKASGTKFQNNDTLFARITPCLENGKTGFMSGLQEGAVGLGSTEFIVMRSKTLTPELVYLIARSDDFRDTAIKSMSGATGRQRVQLPSLEEYAVVVPSKKMLSQFSESLAPMFSLTYSLARKNTALRQTRDLLLPKLISGQLDVSELDIEVTEDAA